MSFGSMFAKTYRVHRIFTRSAKGVVKNKLLQDTQLISLIFVLLIVDGLIVTLWVTVDPIERQLRNLSLEISPIERSIVYQPQIEVCSSQFIHSWLGILYAYKGLLLVVGVYMAWETRHVKIPALNDSQYIGLSVYSVVITSVLVVVLANLVSERVTLAFLSIAVPILALTTGSLCLLFFPKLHNILGNTNSTSTLDPIMQSMGLKIECNTRRFLADDRRELHFRVEVQNKVYRRELHLLDNEINKLERQLAHECSSSSSHSSIPVNKNEFDEVMGKTRGKSPSISGGIPLLLLSVLPPVIPRASWPTEDSRRGVTFSSEPKLGEQRASLNLLPPEQPPKLSVIGKFLNMITPSVRKSSAPAGLASALRAHMEYFAGFVPGNNSGSLESSCNTSHTGINRAPYLNIDDDYDIRERKFSLGYPPREEIRDEDRGRRQARSYQSLSQPRVSFSIQHQHSQPILPYREKPKGSPRFPHRIVPTSSLGDLKKRDYLVVTKGETKSRSLEETRERNKDEKRGGSLSPNSELWFNNEPKS
ncbi:unnamed protein product [Nezara viridula]|uniref:G-protein coupled receptors family 3 profile domain-containing protein n=1 Tax=Nezara viridula TaxID=85310 RepID=A0A9P0H728_NEZVI|nr:unnamed protein product [Nezara viridula]